MRINPISQNNQSFKAVNQKYYKRAAKEIETIKGVTGDLLCCLSYDILWKKISAKDGVDTLNAIKKILLRSDLSLEHDLKIYENMLKAEQSNQ